MAAFAEDQRSHRRIRSVPLGLSVNTKRRPSPLSAPAGRLMKAHSERSPIPEEDANPEVPQHWLTPDGYWTTFPPTNPHVTSWLPVPHRPTNNRSEIDQFLQDSKKFEELIARIQPSNRVRSTSHPPRTVSHHLSESHLVLSSAAAATTDSERPEPFYHRPLKRNSAPAHHRGKSATFVHSNSGSPQLSPYQSDDDIDVEDQEPKLGASCPATTSFMLDSFRQPMEDSDDSSPGSPTSPLCPVRQRIFRSQSAAAVPLETNRSLGMLDDVQYITLKHHHTPIH